MAVHRYWRLASLESYGGVSLALSELQLFSESTRVDAAATLSSNVAPSTGSLSSLNDNSVATDATWLDARGLILSWDFGSGGAVDVTNLLLGSTSDRRAFPLVANLQFSDDGATWSDRYSLAFAGIKWPGPRAKTDNTTRTIIGKLRFDKSWSDQSMSGQTPYTTAGSYQHEVANGYRLWLGTSAVTDVRSRFATMPSMTDVDISAFVNLVGRPTLVFRSSYWGNPNDTFAYAAGLDSGNVAFGRGSNSAVGAYTGLASVAHGLPGNGDVLMRVTMIGSAYKVYLNGVLKLSGTDTTFPGAGEVGVRTFNATSYFNTLQVREPEETHPLIALDTAFVRMTRLAVVPSLVSIPLPYGQARTQPALRGSKDYLTGILGDGIGRVRGFTLDYVNPLNKPYPCRVRLMREADGLVVREQWSKADGSYDFQFIDELQSYTVLAYYLAHAKRAVVTDGLTLANGKVELMA